MSRGGCPVNMQLLAVAKRGLVCELNWRRRTRFANLCVDGRYGFEIRQILEGPAWRKWDKRFKRLQLRLGNLEEACKTHEILVGVQMALTTSDGFLILQRWSEAVQSAAGGAKWDDFNFAGNSTGAQHSDRFLIVFRSPDRDDETGLPIHRSEKMRAVGAWEHWRGILSSPV